MSEVTIDIKEFKTLIKTQERYNMLLNAIANASYISLHWYKNEEEACFYVRDSDLLNAFKIIDEDCFEAIYEKKYLEARAEAEAEAVGATEEKEEKEGDSEDDTLRDNE